MDHKGQMDEPFNLDNFVDAATGRPASEVIGGPGHYKLSPKSEESENPPPASDMLGDLMQQKHDPTELSVTIPVKKLMEVIVEIGNVQRKAQANGQLCMEKTQELVRLRAELSACQQSREEKIDTISRVWTLLENESPLGEDLSAKDVRAALIGQPEVDAKSVLGQDVEDPDLITRVPTAEELRGE